MARPDKVYVRFRGVVAADLTGAWGDATTPDLLCVDLDASGQLIAAVATGDAVGVIWTPEGKQDESVPDFNVALAGSVMTVFVAAEIVGAIDGFAAGDGVFSIAAGDVDDGTAGTQRIGIMADSDEGGDRLILNVSL